MESDGIRICAKQNEVDQADSYRRARSDHCPRANDSGSIEPFSVSIAGEGLLDRQRWRCGRTDALGEAKSGTRQPRKGQPSRPKQTTPRPFSGRDACIGSGLPRRWPGQPAGRSRGAIRGQPTAHFGRPWGDLRPQKAGLPHPGLFTTISELHSCRWLDVFAVICRMTCRSLDNDIITTISVLPRDSARYFSRPRFPSRPLIYRLLNVIKSAAVKNDWYLIMF